MIDDRSHICGLHHVTAIASGAQANVDFYTRVLGLRLVKRIVNFDAPDTYHFYYGNGAGGPGSLLTIFPFEDAAAGRIGTSMAETTAFAIPEAALEAWMSRRTCARRLIGTRRETTVSRRRSSGAWLVPMPPREPGRASSTIRKSVTCGPHSIASTDRRRSVFRPSRAFCC